MIPVVDEWRGKRARGRGPSSLTTGMPGWIRSMSRASFIEELREMTSTSVFTMLPRGELKRVCREREGQEMGAMGVEPQDEERYLDGESNSGPHLSE
jgi:hypothetical protein